MKIILKSVFTALGAIIFLNGLIVSFISNPNMGIFLAIALGAALILTTLFFEKIKGWIRITFIVLISLAVVFSSFLLIYGKTDTTDFDEDAVIVLGAAVHGKTPSLTLRHRLDKAVQFHQNNPDTLIVVSGGQGNGEDITEAEAMKNYLTEKGVNPEVIIEESEATSTYENFTLSKSLLDTRLGDDYSVCFITNEYHVFRASFCAKQAGISDSTHFHSSTTLSYLLPGVLRECLAVIKYFIFRT